jgi:hypothetical protein
VPIRFSKETYDDLKDAVPRIQRFIEAGNRNAAGEDLLTIRVPSNAADGVWGHKGLVRVSVGVESRHYGKRHKERLGHYSQIDRHVVLFADTILAQKNEHVVDTLLHELGHAQDFEHDRAFYVAYRSPHAKEVRDFVIKEVDYVFSALRPEAFPKNLKTPNERAIYIAKAIVRGEAAQEFLKKNGALDATVLFNVIHRYVNTGDHIDALEKLLNEEKRYLRQPTEMRAFTQNVLQEVRRALKEERCGNTALLKQAGVWGTKCAAFMLKDASPTFVRMKGKLSKAQLQRVLNDVARVLQEEFFAAQNVGKKDDRRSGKRNNALIDKIGAEAEAIFAGMKKPEHLPSRTIAAVLASPTYERAQHVLSEEDRKSVLFNAAIVVLLHKGGATGNLLTDALRVTSRLVFGSES